jgi:diguanylate cyclase (GGDEF)-like protein
MRPSPDDIGQRVAKLLADPQYLGHPLHDALREVWHSLGDNLERIERITRLSDSYQAVAREREMTMYERFDRELRRLSKIVRISDRYQDALQDLNATLKEASNRDPLTELPNRRGLMMRLKQEVERATRSGSRYAVVMLDVDHFKSVNDQHGHEAGDQVLMALGRTLTNELRAYDVCGRWGGEEFLMLLPETTLEEAQSVVTRTLATVRALQIPLEDKTLSLTLSAGIALSRPGENLSAPLNRADAALYMAKQQGRDRLALEKPLAAPLPAASPDDSQH